VSEAKRSPRSPPSRAAEIAARADVKVRAMTAADYPEVLALWKASPGVGLSESDTEQGVASFLARNPELSTVACADGMLVGAVLCGYYGRRGYLHHLAVAATHRRRGIAAAVLEHCFRRLETLGIPKCNIFLFSDNHDGAAFWRHVGFSSRDDLRVFQSTVPPKRG
jgi:N-acetylglutamate synthase